MSQNSRQRRDARRRAVASSRRPSPPQPQTLRTTGHLVPPSQAEIVGLIELAADYAVASPRAAAPRIELLNELSAMADDPRADPAALAVEQVLSRVAVSWEQGWQPHDLVHAAKRRTSTGVAKWLARAVLVEAERTQAAQRGPQAWVDQLTILAGRRHLDEPEGLLGTRGGASVEAWTTVLVALDFLSSLPPSQRLLPPPSQWGHARERDTSPRTPRRAGHDPKMLTRIRALLAKAESTDHPAEAEAFTAKAQELMTRHAIDEALLADRSGHGFDVEGLRVLIDHPYAQEKASLLHVVAKANRSRAIWHEFASYATIVGAPTDLSQVEMLFTSTLVQATRAMTQAGEQSRGADRTSGFRRAFLTAYAVRIGERLVETTARTTDTYGAGLVPVFERQAEAVKQEFDRIFPHTTQTSSRPSYDARGWHAGTQAADDAVLPAAEVER